MNSLLCKIVFFCFLWVGASLCTGFSCSSNECCSSFANPNEQTGEGYYDYNKTCLDGGMDLQENDYLFLYQERSIYINPYSSLKVFLKFILVVHLDCLFFFMTIQIFYLLNYYFSNKRNIFFKLNKHRLK